MKTETTPRSSLLKRLYVLERQLDLFGFAPWERDALMGRDFSRGGRRGKAAGGAAASGGMDTGGGGAGGGGGGHRATPAPLAAAPVVNTGRTYK